MDSIHRSTALIAGALAVIVVVIGVLGTSGATVLSSHQCGQPCDEDAVLHGEVPSESPAAVCLHAEACGGVAGAHAAAPLAMIATVGVLVPPLVRTGRLMTPSPGLYGRTIASGIDRPPRFAA